MQDDDDHHDNGEASSSPSPKRRRQAPKIDRTLNWNTAEVLKLISAIEENPELWDLRCSGHSDLGCRTASWQRIEDTVYRKTIPYEQLMKKWQLLCQTHSKYVSQIQSDPEADRTINWAYWKKMQFLRHAKMEPIENTVSVYSSNDSLQSQSSSQSEGHQTMDSKDFSEHPSIKVEPKFDDDESTMGFISPTIPVKEPSATRDIRPIAPTIKRSNKGRSHRPDEFDDFGSYIASSLRILPAELVERAMAALNYSMAVESKDAAEVRSSRVRQAAAENAPREELLSCEDIEDSLNHEYTDYTIQF